MIRRKHSEAAYRKQLTNSTFFDSNPAAPGTASSNWITVASAGALTATYPDGSETDGTSTATVLLSSFDPGDILNFNVDLDLFANPDGSGAVNGTMVTAHFRDLSNNFVGNVSLTLTESPVTLNGNSYTHSASIPEPAAIVLSGLGSCVLLRRRRL